MSNHQSSSTTLFNDIYRSLDKVRSKKMQDTRPETKNIQSRNSLVRDGNSKVEETEDQRRTCLIDDWMEKKRIHTRPVPPLDSSYASSSHNTSPAFSSSGSESLRPAKNRDSCLPPFKPEADPHHHRAFPDIQTKSEFPVPERMRFDNYNYVSANQETGQLKSHPRAHKLYADLNKSKLLLPISPGAKLTIFINSMLNRRRERKASYPSSAADDFESPDSHVSYTCSSASSSTRSCLVSKSSPSSLKDHKPVRRSVRFYSLSVEHSVEIQSRNGEHSGTSISTKKDENLKFSSMDDNGDDIDDAASNTSSDLFEIDHIIFATINSNNSGTDADELPVFETTNVYGRKQHQLRSVRNPCSL